MEAGVIKVVHGEKNARERTGSTRAQGSRRNESVARRNVRWTSDGKLWMKLHLAGVSLGRDGT